MPKKDKTTYDNKSKTDGEKKGSVTDAGYNEENEKHPDHTRKNPAPSAKNDKPGSSGRNIK
ncbi:MAG: hypothetical protein ABIQ56_00415 [Chitinophagaceae bacterium]